MTEANSSCRPYDIWVDYLGLNKVVFPPTDNVSEDFSATPDTFAKLPSSAHSCDTNIWGFPITTSYSRKVPVDTRVPENLPGTITIRNNGRKSSRSKQRFCAFCKTNGEVDDIYLGHVLKDSYGRTTCPYLRKYTCPICGESGDKAHTIKYCPYNMEGISTAPLKTSRTSAGRKRAC